MRIRTLWLALSWVWVAVVFYLSLTPHPPEPFSFSNADKLEHMLAYGLLMLWFCQLQFARIWLAAAFVAMGIGLEFLQGMSGFRHFDYADMVGNSAGVVVGWWVARTRAGRILEFVEQHVKKR
jgi:hypothetical protein